MIGKNVFPLLEKLIEEQAILYYLRRPHSIILLKNEPAEQDFHIDNICFQIMQQTHQLHE